MRKLLWLTPVLLVLACLRIGWIFYSRRSAEREAQRHVLQQQAQEDRTTINAYGGDRLTILNFYSTPSTIHRGQTAQLCYGVSNAKSVRIEPPVENVWPSLSRCVDVTPKRDTAYKLIAEDANAHTETATAAVNVR
jgi:hypothetical protein